MNYFRHERAIVESDQIGDNTRVWANAHILPGAIVGADCNICDGVFIENDVVVGNRVTIKCGVQLWDGVRLEDDVFIGPNATFTNDRFPRSGAHLGEYPRTTIQTGASVGANATILPGLVVGRYAMVGAGAVVTKSVPSNAIVVGNPARITGYVGSDSGGAKSPSPAPAVADRESRDSTVAGVRLIKLPIIPDMRGALSFAETGQHLPFTPRRYFLVFDVPSREGRGEHAHRRLHQFLVCVAGSCHVMVDDGRAREEFVLDSPGLAVHIPPMVWGVQYKYSADAILLVLASDVYDETDYIRDYDEFLSAVRTGSGADGIPR